jgi:hypothetical protein
VANSPAIHEALRAAESSVRTLISKIDPDASRDREARQEIRSAADILTKWRQALEFGEWQGRDLRHTRSFED